jgi:hypothetical protein
MFYHEYIAQKRPVIITGGGGAKGNKSALEQLGWKTDAWDQDYLKQHAGHVNLRVERVRKGTKFGHDSTKVNMTFGTFLDDYFYGEPDDNATDFERLHYLNMQRNPGGPVLGAPLSLLAADFSLPSFIMAGTRSIHAVNIWTGNTHGGYKSKMHHDGSDNLYAVIKGRKQFTIFAPSDAENLYTRGEMVRVDPRGGLAYVAERQLQPHFSEVTYPD